MNKVSVVIPCCNEEQTISRVIRDVESALRAAQCEYEIIVIDDGSTDATPDRLSAHRDIVLIRNPYRKGTGNARKQGILKARHEIIMMIDADGTYPVSPIAEFIESAQKYGQIIGARKQEFGRYKYPRIIMKWIIRSMASCLTGVRIQDLNSGMRVFRKDKVLPYLELIPDGFSCTTTLTMIFLFCRYPVKFMPIEYYERKGTSKFRPFQDTLNCFFAIFRTYTYFKIKPKIGKTKIRE